MSGFIKLLVLVLGVVNLGVTAYFSSQSWETVAAIPVPERAVASVDEHGAAAGEHGAAPAAGEHGAPAGDHGAAPAAGAHGAAPAAPGKDSAHALRSWVTLEEMYVNIASNDDDVHTLAFKLEVELFEENSRHQMEQRQALVKNAIIEIARQQPYESLQSLAGKLYFKEALVAQVNQTVAFPLIRDVHLASFFVR